MTNSRACDAEKYAFRANKVWNVGNIYAEIMRRAFHILYKTVQWNFLFFFQDLKKCMYNDSEYSIMIVCEHGEILISHSIHPLSFVHRKNVENKAVDRRLRIELCE